MIGSLAKGFGSPTAPPLRVQKKKKQVTGKHPKTFVIGIPLFGKGSKTFGTLGPQGHPCGHPTPPSRLSEFCEAPWKKNPTKKQPQNNTQSVIPLPR